MSLRLILVFKTLLLAISFFLKFSIMVSFDENLTLCPVWGSTTIITIPSGTLKGLDSDFKIVFSIKFLKIGNAVFAPVSYLPNGSGLSDPA